MILNSGSLTGWASGELMDCRAHWNSAENASCEPITEKNYRKTVSLGTPVLPHDQSWNSQSMRGATVRCRTRCTFRNAHVGGANHPVAGSKWLKTNTHGMPQVFTLGQPAIVEPLPSINTQGWLQFHRLQGKSNWTTALATRFLYSDLLLVSLAGCSKHLQYQLFLNILKQGT